MLSGAVLVFRPLSAVRAFGPRANLFFTMLDSDDKVLVELAMRRN